MARSRAPQVEEQDFTSEDVEAGKEVEASAPAKDTQVENIPAENAADASPDLGMPVEPEDTSSRAIGGMVEKKWSGVTMWECPRCRATTFSAGQAKGHTCRAPERVNPEDLQ